MSLPVKVSLYGMDARSQELMKIFLQGACKNKAIIVKEHEAEVDLIDADLISSSAGLEQRINQYPLRPVILISLKEFQIENIICLHKPVQADKMLNAIAQAKQKLVLQDNNNLLENKIIDFQKAKDAVQQNLHNQIIQTEPSFGFSEHKKTNKYKTALSLSEHNFSDFIELLPDINYEDQAQWPRATYQPEHYFQGFIQSAISKSKQENKTLKFSFKDCSLALLPRTNEIWFDTNDNKLKVLANLGKNETRKLNHKLTVLTPEDPINDGIKNAMDKFWDMDAMLWKIACWTSRGRYPASLDYDLPVFLNSWPNFTRLLVTPHALRIAALLIERPRTLANIIEVLNIKPQYVFVFISAAYALDHAGQAERNADVLIEPPQVKENNRRQLLNQLVHKLIGN